MHRPDSGRSAKAHAPTWSVILIAFVAQFPFTSPENAPCEGVAFLTEQPPRKARPLAHVHRVHPLDGGEHAFSGAGRHRRRDPITGRGQSPVLTAIWDASGSRTTSRGRRKSPAAGFAPLPPMTTRVGATGERTGVQRHAARIPVKRGHSPSPPYWAGCGRASARAWPRPRRGGGVDREPMEQRHRCRHPAAQPPEHPRAERP